MIECPPIQTPHTYAVFNPRMAANSPEQRNRLAALEIKAGSITLPILKVFTADLGVLSLQLEQKLGRAPDFFRNAPIIIDLGELDPDRERLDFPALIEVLRNLDLSPVGVRGGNPVQQYAAQTAKLAILADIRGESHVAHPAAQPAPAKSPASAPPRPAGPGPTKLIDHPVRSGQRIYAAGGDLIVLAQVSPGAEIMADGNIHIYGSLKGRALAGVQGDLGARIFCSDLQAELIAIGGHYKISENLDGVVRGKPVQAYLRDDSLIIEHL
jgi:septum site-determining protein MinC